MMVPGIHQDHAESGTTPYSLNLKPTLLVLAIAQALALQAAQAASIEVTSNLDDGTDCTLREALATINAGADQLNGCIITGDALGTNDTITFGPAVSGQIITSALGELQITKDVSINPGGVNTTIDANGVGRVFGIGGVGQRISVELDQLTLTGGNSGGNSVRNGGGGIYVGRSLVTLSNSTVSGNSAGRFGGGIVSYNFSIVTVSNSTVSGNSARYGGGVVAFDASVTLSNSTVSGNSADRGGGIYAYVSNVVTLTNSTVSGNSAGSRGGGIFASDGSPVTLTNSTVSRNSAGSGGGGIEARLYADITLSNSIVANSLGADCANFDRIVTATADSIIEDGSCGTAAMSVDPVLGPLAANGGPTKTHALLAGSSAIDNGTGAGATAFDQRGVAAEGVRDSGAYEFTAAMNALAIDKLINNMARETPGTAAQLLAGSLYRQKYMVTNNSQDHLYQVRVFEDGNLVCNVYTLDPGETKERCNTVQTVLAGNQHAPVTVNAKVSGSSDTVSTNTDAYYAGISNVQGQMKVTHYINDRNADTPGQAQTLPSQQAKVLFKIENTGKIELYRVKTYHDPVSPVNSGWEQQCVIGPLKPDQVSYCKKDITLSEPGFNHAMGRAQGVDAFASPTGVINAANPTYFIVP